MVPGGQITRYFGHHSCVRGGPCTPRPAAEAASAGTPLGQDVRHAKSHRLERLRRMVAVQRRGLIDPR
jgi:hypothetical protein